MKINAKLLLVLVSVSIVPLAVVGAATYFITERALEDAISRELATVAEGAERDVEGFLAGRLDETGTFATRLRLRQDLREFTANGTPAARASVQAIIDAAVQGPGLVAVTVVDPEARAVATTRETPPEAALLAASRRGPGDVAAVVGISAPAPGATAVATSAPLLLDGTFLGWALLESDVAPMLTRVGSAAGLGPREIVLVVRDETGALKYLLPVALQGEPAVVAPGTPLAAALSGDEQVLRESETADGVAVLAATRSVDPPGFALVARVPRAVAFAPIRDLQVLLAAVVAGLSMGVVLLALVFAWTFTRPVLDLTEAATAVAAGDLGRRATVATSDELGDLARTMNRMTDQLVRSRLELEARFWVLFESAPDATVIVDGDGRIVRVNRKFHELFGYDTAELEGRRVEALVPEGLRAAHVGHREGFVGEPRAREMGVGLDLAAVKKDGTVFPVEIALAPHEGPRGFLVMAAVRDITERREAQRRLEATADALRRSNEELEQFAYVASHDLQEPLRMVASYTQLLERRYKGKLAPEADEFIAFAVDGAKRMQQLINDLLEYSRVTRKGKEPAPVAAGEALAAAQKNLALAIEESHGTVSSDPLPVIRFDHGQLVQLLQNLVGNGVKFRREGVPPRVHVSARRDDDSWVFSVSDNGIGIAAADLPKIFQVFARVNPRDRYPGTGIGLALCRKIVERHGGIIWVESEPSKGSTFFFKVPGDGATA
ncbi:MAG: sensor histidine kinase [Methanobacteriota archaeon]